MNDKTLKNISIIVTIILGLAFIAKFSGPAILRFYVESGVGGCQKNIILCTIPTGEVNNPNINKEYLAELTNYKFPGIEISLPKSFLVIKEIIKKVYYKKMKRKQSEAVAYLLYEKPGFFINLFPQVKKFSIKNNHEFLQRVMYARPMDIKSLNDAFFVIMKSIFIPDLGDKNNIKIIKFISQDKKGFIAYSLGAQTNYFDCNIVDPEDDFFKVYIKDKGAALDLNKIVAIISTLKKN